MINVQQSLVIIGVIAAVTLFLRFAPFIAFRKTTPKIIMYLGNVLPYAIMGMLVVFCLKSVSFTGGSHGIPEAIAVITVVALHKWKHNTLLSIICGTALYMVLVQMIFV